jgi:hypothetical protein
MPRKRCELPLSSWIGSSRLKPETTPTETDCLSSNGSPTAIAHWPALSFELSPN